MPAIATGLKAIPPSQRSGISPDALTIKISPKGLTVLSWEPGATGGLSFGNRYVGSRSYIVDAAGNLFTRADYLLEYPRDKKKGPSLKRSPDKIISKDEIKVQTPCELSTNILELSPENRELSTETVKKNYRVNARIIKQRIQSFLNTKTGGRALYFWTISFPQGTPDNVGHAMFNVWLTMLRKHGLLKMYLWVSERQKNGTIHFHMLVPHFMNVRLANSFMRGTLKTYSKKGLVPFSVHSCSRYNGVDICKRDGRVINFAEGKRCRSLAAYITKYITKNNIGFERLAWHNSRHFSALCNGVCLTYQEALDYGFMEVIDTDKSFFGGGLFFTFHPFAPCRGDTIAKLSLRHLGQVNDIILRHLAFIDSQKKLSKK